jgi:hypothetical protein
LLAIAAIAVLGQMPGAASEGAAIRRRYAALLAQVHPMATPPDRPVVEVTEFATLIKLAERYGLLVLHWSRSGVETFVVQYDGTTFRYRSGSNSAAVTTGIADENISAARTAGTDGGGYEPEPRGSARPITPASETLFRSTTNPPDHEEPHVSYWWPLGRAGVAARHSRGDRCGERADPGRGATTDGADDHGVGSIG